MYQFEKIPDRREPFNLTMLKHCLQEQTFYADDTLVFVLGDWYIISIHLGPRQSEWCQIQHKHEIGSEQ